MTEDTRDHAIVGRRTEDGTVRFEFNLWRAVQWVTLFGGILGLAIWGVNALGTQVVKPRALEEVKAQQTEFTAAQMRQNARLNDVETRLGQMQVVLEIVAVQACRDLRSDPYAYRKANCAQYLETK